MNADGRLSDGVPHAHRAGLRGADWRWCMDAGDGQVGWCPPERDIQPSLIPHKKNTNGRHHIPKMRHAVTDWAEYDAGQRRRGSLTMWITKEAIAGWAATRRATPGGQATYSDSAIQTCRRSVKLRAAFSLALRQAEGSMLSVVGPLGYELTVRDHTTVSRRAVRLESITRGPLHVLIDRGRCTS